MEMEMEAEEISKIRDFHLAIDRPQIIRFRRIWYRRTRVDLLYPMLNTSQAFA